tara:strand:- start:156 stop:977 length:822 start_codon:yes stop_codon:yes gene_type:complete
MVDRQPFDALTLKRFADGHRTEDLIIERLRQVEGITLIDRDPETGEQIEVADHNGHYLGHLDGEILGIKQAPKTWHVFEVKCVGDQAFAKFQKFKRDYHEKNVLKQWNETYYAQAQQYMMYRGMTRHYMVVASAGGRMWDSIRTDYDKGAAEYYSDRARQIIQNTHIIPDRISENASFYQCNWCEFNHICHHGHTPPRNCRTCLYSQTVDHGDWLCGFDDTIISKAKQRVGCNHQRYRPALVPGVLLSSNDEKNTLSYRLQNGDEWTDDGAPI